MSKNGKYQAEITQADDGWQAQIKRQVTSRKTTVSKQQDGFASEAEARSWADEQLTEFTGKQQAANLRQNKNRKQAEQTRTERSTRRSEKTAKKKSSESSELANESPENSE